MPQSSPGWWLPSIAVAGVVLPRQVPARGRLPLPPVHREVARVPGAPGTPPTRPRATDGNDRGRRWSSGFRPRSRLHRREILDEDGAGLPVGGGRSHEQPWTTSGERREECPVVERPPGRLSRMADGSRRGGARVVESPFPGTRRPARSPTPVERLVAPAACPCGALTAKSGLPSPSRSPSGTPPWIRSAPGSPGR